jgi:hypothetical protein
MPRKPMITLKDDYNDDDDDDAWPLKFGGIGLLVLGG